MAAALGWKYEVFLSFRGADTRNTFAGHLYHALKARGINTFIDNRLERGQDICDSIAKVIEGSTISIVIFSTAYAASSSCLEELVKILECRKLRGQLVLPVFFNVDPSDVENQTGCYADSLAELEAQSMEKMVEWRRALTQAAALSGWHLDNGNEAELIQTIVKHISMELNHVPLHVAEYPVGLESHIQEMTNILSFEMDEVQFVGVYGLGGIGKTTIAKAVFNKIAGRFEGSCFLANVREISEKRGVLQLQETLLIETLRLGHEKIRLGNCDRGINVIKKRLCDKKVLIVIDDADELQQLKKLAGGLDWFGLGSRIIITTRDEQLLNVHGVKKRHSVKELCPDEALELFSWHAFKKPQPVDGYLDLSRSVIKYAQSLPLALVVLGSFLYGRSQPEWKSQLNKLNTNPNKEIYDVLKISYNGLENLQKAIFLHIACFFRGYDKDYVMRVLDACDLNPAIEVKVLVEKSLIRIENDKFEMHDLVQAMGRQVVNDESPSICERSRLWNQDDILQVLSEDMGPFKTEAIVADFPSEEVSVEAFAKMKRLKILIAYYANIGGSPENLSNDLRWLEWPEYHLESLPSTFRRRKLVGLKLEYSCIKELGTGFKSFINLKDLDLGGCHLQITPDFSMIANLECLRLCHCKNLVEVHESVGYLNKLELLGLQFCSKLTVLPSRFQLPSLRSLLLTECEKLKKFPEIVEEMTFLEEIDLSGTAIESLPLSIHNVSGLRPLTLRDCKQKKTPLSSIYYWKHLKSLDLEGCVTLEKLPRSIKWLDNLSRLRLSGCPKLEEIPELPFSIELVEARDCKSLERYSQLERVFAFNWKAKSLIAFDFSNCRKLAKSQDTISADGLQNQQSLAKSPIKVVFPGSKIPEWFNYIWENQTSISFELPSQAYEKLEALALCAIINSKNLRITVYVNGQIVHCYSRNFFRFEVDHVWLSYLPRCSFTKHVPTAKNDNVQFKVSMDNSGWSFKSCGVYFVYGQGVNPDDAVAWSSIVDLSQWLSLSLKPMDQTTWKPELVEKLEDKVRLLVGPTIHTTVLRCNKGDASPRVKRRKIAKDSLVLGNETEHQISAPLVANNATDCQIEPAVDEHQLSQWLSLSGKPMDEFTLNPKSIEKLEHQTGPLADKHQLSQWLSLSLNPVEQTTLKPEFVEKLEDKVRLLSGTTTFTNQTMAVSPNESSGGIELQSTTEGFNLRSPNPVDQTILKPKLEKLEDIIRPLSDTTTFTNQTMALSCDESSEDTEL